jgi:hypothetical protein
MAGMPNIVRAAPPGFAPAAAGVAIGAAGRAIGGTACAEGAGLSTDLGAGAGAGVAAGIGFGAAVTGFAGSSPLGLTPGAPPGAMGAPLGAGALPSDLSCAPGIPKTVLAIPSLLFRLSAFSITSKTTTHQTFL